MSEYKATLQNLFIMMTGVKSCLKGWGDNSLTLTENLTIYQPRKLLLEI